MVGLLLACCWSAAGARLTSELESADGAPR
jgi:hypothetical protein